MEFLGFPSGELSRQRLKGAYHQNTPLLTDTEPLKNLIDNLILHRITRNLP